MSVSVTPPGYTAAAASAAAALVSETAAASSAATAAAAAAKIGSGKNLFDVDASYGPDTLWASGTVSSVAGYYASAKIPVTPGATYAMNCPRNYLYFDSGGTYVGGSLVSTPAQTPVSVTIPGSGVGFLAFSVSTANVTRAQLELGSASTWRETFGARVGDLLAAGCDVESFVEGAHRIGVRVWRSGNSYVARFGFDATQDVLIPFETYASSEFQLRFTNPVVGSIYLLPRESGDTAAWPVLDSGVVTQVHSPSDDNAPFGSWGGHVGGNHGWACGYTITAASHGKTTADLGSVWSDGVRQFTLLKITSVNQVMVAGHYTVDGSGVVAGVEAAPTATLTHVSGATHTTSIPISGGVSSGQIHPSSYGHVQSVLVDGRPVPDGGVAQGLVLTATSEYTIASYKDLIDTQRANVGTDVLANMSMVDPYATVTESWRMDYSGLILVSQCITAVETIRSGLGVSQMAALKIPSGGVAKQMMAGVGTIDGNDYGGLVDLASVVTDANVTTATNPAWPATRMIQVVYDSGAQPVYGFTMGYLPVRDGEPPSRIALCDGGNQWQIRASSKKNYPHVAQEVLLQPGEYLNGVMWRKYLPPSEVLHLHIDDGVNQWATIDRPTTSTGDRLYAPGVMGTLNQVGPATVRARTATTPTGITYTAPSVPAYGMWRLDPPRMGVPPMGDYGVGRMYHMPRTSSSSLSMAGLFNTLMLSPLMFPSTIRVDRVVFTVDGAGSGSLRLGLYAHDPRTGYPAIMGPLQDWGAGSVATPGDVVLTVDGWVPGGLSWLGWVWQGTSTTPPTIVGADGAAPMVGSGVSANGAAGWTVTGVSGGLGAVTIGATHSLSMPSVSWRMA